MTTAELINRLRALGVQLQVADGNLKVNAPKGVITPELADQIRAHKAELIELLASEATGRQRIPTADRSKPLPLSFAQQRLWFIDQFEGGSSVYNIPWAMRMRGPLNRDALQAAVDQLIVRHESLRTVFVAGDAEPEQQVLATMPLTVELLRMHGATDAEIRGQLESWSQERFALDRGPLLRVRLIETGAAEHVLMMNMHHIITDAWSLDVLQSELFTLYFANIAGRTAELSDLPLQFADYATWQREQLQGAALQAQLDYWKGQLGDAPPVLELPTDRPRPAEQSFRGARVRRELPGTLRDRLKQFANSHNATLFMVMLAVFDILLARYTNSDDIVVGSPVAGRQNTKLEGLIGLFLNTLVLRTDLSGNPSFTELLARVRDMALDAYDHQVLPFDKLVEELRPSRDLSYAPVYQVQFVLQNAPTSGSALQGLEFSPVDFDYGTAKFDLSLAAGETADGLMAEFEYATDLFDAATIERMLAHYERLLEAVLDDPATPVFELPMLDNDDRRQLAAWNETTVSYPQGLTLVDLFTQQVARTPDAIAVEFGAQALTYAELDGRANRLAHELRELGALRDAVIGVYMERSIEMVVALYGIIKAGAAYAPLDPDYPAQRIANMLEDAAAGIVLTQPGLTGGLTAFTGRVIALDSDGHTGGDFPATAPEIRVAPADLAYVIFTSGSTGRPKGVMNEHRGIVNRLLWMQGEYGLDATDAVLQKTAFSFDVSVWEFFWPLQTGARLVMAQPGGHKDPQYLRATINRCGITTLHFVPSMLQAFLLEMPPGSCPGLRRVICSGEALPYEVTRVFYERCNAGLHNLYGPTEAAIDVSYWPCPRDNSARRVPIGRPVANTQLHIVDAANQPTPIGVPGELLIGGVQVARGYINRTELTAERFVADPFSDKPDARIYRTGDLARYLPDGNIEYIGRIDAQVKLRGFRIELGEIEARLREHPQIADALAIVREDTPGDQRLVAYIVCSAAATAPAHAELAQWLEASLPAFMVPAAIVTLDAIPLTPNGKADRKALPIPEWSSGAAYRAPGTATEKALAGIWADILGADRVGCDDDFFALGGHSLLATRVVMRVRDELGAELDLRTLFRTPTVAGIAATLRADAAAHAPIPVTPHADGAPLTPAQQRIWFLQELEQTKAPYNVPWAVRVRGALDLPALQTAIGALVARHESLRTVFAQQGNTAVQRVQADVTIPVTRETCTDEAALANRVTQLAAAPFDLRQGPLLRVNVITRGTDDQLLLLVIHHIVADAESLQVLFDELMQHYAAARNGTSATLPALPVQYADYAIWHNARLAGTALDTQRTYWKQQLTGIPALHDLPTDRPRPRVQSYAGATLGRLLAPELATGVRRLGSTGHATPFMTLQAAFFALLRRYSGQDDIVVGTPVSGRDRSELAGLIGFFLNTLVLRADLAANPSFSELLQQVRGTALDAFANQELPFEQLVEELQPERNTSSAPLFQVLFTVVDELQTTPAYSLTAIEPWSLDHHTAKFDLTLTVTITAAGLGAAIEYSTDLFDRSSIERLLEHYERLLAAVIADPQVRVDDIVLLDNSERRHVIDDFNALHATYPEHSVVALVEQQAQRTPDAVAISSGAATLSYAELNARANRFAHYLIDNGVGPGKRVAVSLTRCATAPVAILAVLKTGAAYVPVDPAYPEDRIAYMLDDCRAQAVVAARAAFASLGAHAAGAICSDDFDWTTGDASNPATRIMAASAAYAIYTSGSTGEPKGAVMTHGGLANLLQWQATQPGLDRPARTLQFASFSFDVSFQELFSTWSQGGTLVMIDEALRLDLQWLAAFIAADRIERVFMPFAAMQPLAEFLVAESAASGARLVLRDCVVAGEQLQVTPAIRSLFSKLADARLHNHYGPSETHVVTALTLAGDPAEWPALPSIGTPVANNRIYVLDGRQQPLPVGVPGELYIGGTQVGSGYLGRPELTAAKFMADPHAAGGRMYRSGDRARFRANGSIDYLGRSDDQVKVRGFRVEPGEIEAVLALHPQVQQAVVVVRDAGGEKRLVGYVVASADDTGELREWLAERLPAYMVPAAIVRLEELPLTPSGKVARRALPEPVWRDTRSYRAPRNPTEAALAVIWAEVLRLEQVGIDDDFFALGGHSLLAMHLVARIRDTFGVGVPLATLFDNATVAHIAKLLPDAAAEQPITPVGRDRPLPLSFAQQRLWFLEIMEPGTPTYNVPWAIALDGPLDLPALQTAVDALVARHEPLRTRFATGDDDPVQLIEAHVTVSVDFADCSNHSEQELQATLLEHTNRPFDLAHDALLRVAVFRVAANRHVLHFNVHHIVCDAWSQGLLMQDLAAFYAAAVSGTPAQLPVLPVQYADYAVWQREWLQGAELERQFAYWKERLAGLPPLLNLPLDHPRPAVETHAGAMAELRLGTDVMAGVHDIARDAGCTPFAVLLAAFQTLLHRYAGEDDIVVGTPVSGRGRSELEGILGFFLNTLAIRTDLAGNPGFAATVDQVRRHVIDAFAHQDLPFEKLVEELQPERNLSHAPIFQALFVYTAQGKDNAAWEGLDVRSFEIGFEGAKFDLQLTATEHTGGLALNLLYNRDLFRADSMERMLAHLQQLLQAVIMDPATGVDDIVLLDAAERRRVTRDFNATQADYPEHSVVALFTKQAARTPDAVALESAGAELSYREVNARANRLAHALITRGIGPGHQVAICIERGTELPLAILAVLKTGAAYVPVDPKYPAERVAYMLDDCGAGVVLSATAQLDALGDRAATAICLDDFDWDNGDAADPQVQIAADSSVYGIYTSGSTGLPKGALMSHGGLANLLQWQQTQPGLDRPARTLQFASFSFDVSFQEIFSTWTQGGTLLMIDEELRLDLPALARFIAERGIERLFMPFAAMQPLAELLTELPPALADKLAVRDCIVAGEQLQVTQSLRKLFTQLGARDGKARLHNHYGPSETHVVTAHTLAGDPAEWPALPPIGKPVANTRIYVLDTRGAPLPVGVPGELHIAGVQVGPGYLGKPELTAEKFGRDPFADPTVDPTVAGAAARSYRSGDKARFLADGTLEYLGRTDDQVKWRGFRIEPGEIETCLTAHPQIRRASVVLREDNGEKRLVAYVVCEAGATLDTPVILRHVKDSLPPHMVPSHVMLLDALPLTPSGKVARRQLPPPVIERAAATGSAAPASRAERALAQIWSELLKVPAVGLDDDFFDLGGHSLLTIKLIKHIETATGEHLSIADVFENPTVRELAVVLADAEWQNIAVEAEPDSWFAALKRLFSRSK